ncbi:MAG: IgA Peptidase M64 [Bacteroidetes bacterium]|nr:IgA Peptidase M64 [Bacteroidota bacterium]
MTISIFSLFFGSIFAQNTFDKYFFDKSLRIDYFNVGDAKEQIIAFDEMREEPYWGGPKKNLIDKFSYGNYRFEVVDLASNEVIYSKGYSTLFAEWLTTAEAKQVRRAFSETITLPYPREKVKVNLYQRNVLNTFDLKFTFDVDPESPFIKKDRRNVFNASKVLDNGKSDDKVDIVIVPDGYTKIEMSKFKKDAERFASLLLNSSPYKENKNNFNIWYVESPSIESGTDIPRNGVYQSTIANSSFYTFDVERYLMTEDNKTLRDLAANAPYDLIYLLVNSDKYGGGAIYNHYSVAVSDNQWEEYLIVHEFGHGFAGLGDEYYTSQVAYEEFYKPGIEPWERNLTTLTEFEFKWKSLIDDSTPIPTPSDSIYFNKVGVFEGGGYVPKGVYRPMFDCTMKSKTVDNFCVVCKKAIQDMIDYYCDR